MIIHPPYLSPMQLSALNHQVRRTALRLSDNFLAEASALRLTPREINLVLKAAYVIEFQRTTYRQAIMFYRPAGLYIVVNLSQGVAERISRTRPGPEYEGLHFPVSNTTVLED